MVRLGRRQQERPPEEIDPQWVWALDAHPGHLPMMEAAGTVAAPLLAGFSLTLLVLILPSLGEKTNTAPGGRTLFVTADPLSRYAEPAAILLLLAGLLLIACLQATVTLIRYRRTPAEMRDWFPEHIRTTEPATFNEKTRLSWHNAKLETLKIDDTWYSGKARYIQRSDLPKALKWASRARNTYHGGILCLLLGLVLLAAPPAGDSSAWRWALTGVAALGVLAEVVWIRSGKG